MVIEINCIVGILMLMFITGAVSLMILMLIDVWLDGVFSKYLTKKLEKKLNKEG